MHALFVPAKTQKTAKKGFLLQAGPAKTPKICVFNLKRKSILEHKNLTHYNLIYDKN